MSRPLPLLLSLFLACSGEKAPVVGNLDTADTATDPLDCEDQLIPGIEWFDLEVMGTWSGDFEFGQTHVTEVDETRQAPAVIAERETLLLFTPDEAIDSGSDVRLSAWDGDSLLGTLQMQAPEDIPTILEQDLTDVALDPYSLEAWSATLPWRWVSEGVEVRIGTAQDSGIRRAEHIFSDLGAPQRFTVTRSKIVLFGDENNDTATRPGEQITQDYFGSLPVAELRWIDTTDWILDSVVVATADGYRMVYSEDERLSLTTDTSRWNIIKHQFALRMSVANTGRGLVLNEGWEGDSSPYSFGTSVVMGWVIDGDGNASDIDDAGVAAGWTGWTGMWANECGNTFIHELGHSCTLNHFTSGTAASWGISTEYPNDGQNMSTHPWGYDTSRRQFRTWYQVNGDGPSAGSDEDKNGKYDPMNGGESTNSITCFPQYTGYQAAVIQSWSQGSPTLAKLDGEAGAWLWNAEDARYDLYDVDSAYQQPTEVDVPVVTLIGTLGGLEAETQQTYPPIYAISGNVFAMPDPEDSSLDSEFDGAQWFLRISYADGSLDRALIDVGDLASTDFFVYALNLASERDPVQVDLYYSESAWPEIDVPGATLIHTREIAVPDPETLTPVVSAGRGQLANGSLVLDSWCTPGMNCDTRDAQSSWREAGGALTFRDASGEVGETENCLEPDAYSTLTVAMIDEDGAESDVVVHAQRLVGAGGNTIAVPLNDSTPWIDAEDLTQAIRVWLPYEENSHLAVGNYRNYPVYFMDAFIDGEWMTEIPLEVTLEVFETIDAPLADGYWAGPVSQDDSAVYYTVTDDAIGPTWGVWWEDGVDGPPVLSVPVIDQATGEATTLYADAYKVACDYWWDFHSAQSAGDGVCDNYAVLYVSSDNPYLESGHSYQSPGSSPIVLEAYRWHSPNPYTLLESFPLRVSYTVP